MFVPTSERVRLNTSDENNARLARELEERLDYYASHVDEIEPRLEALDREWDVERTLETHAAVVGLTGVVLGATVDRRFFFVPAIVSAFLLQHALQGWCPPLPVFRRLGIRTQTEIERERYALKALRGDFRGSGVSGNGHG